MQLASTKKLFSFGHWSERSLRMYCHSGVFSTSLTDHWFDSRSSIEMLNRKSREIENVFVPKQLSCLLDNWIMILFVKNGPFPAFFLYFRLFNTVDSKQMFNKSLPMPGFKPRISGVGGNRSTTEPHHCPN